jgi:hypothetical protein
MVHVKKTSLTLLAAKPQISLLCNLVVWNSMEVGLKYEHFSASPIVRAVHEINT